MARRVTKADLQEELDAVWDSLRIHLDTYCEQTKRPPEEVTAAELAGWLAGRVHDLQAELVSQYWVNETFRLTEDLRALMGSVDPADATPEAEAAYHRNRWLIEEESMEALKRWKS